MELRNIGGRFYFYRVSSKWDKEKKVTKKITHEMIGRVTEEDGIIPRGQNPRSKKKETLASEAVSASSASKQPLVSSAVGVREHGASSFIMDLAWDIRSKLKEFFPAEHQAIFIMALNRLLYQAPFKNMKFLYESSYISQALQGVDLSKNKLTALMKALGGDREKIAGFMRSFSLGHEHIVFDTTHLVSNSNKMQLNQKSYTSTGSFDPQVNLLYMFSTDAQTPVYYRIFPGNIQGMKALKLTMQEAKLKNATVVGDKGFCSNKNIDHLEAGQLKYILPLKRESRLLDYTRLASRDYDKAFDGHFFYHNRAIFYYSYKKDDRNVIIFHDPKLRTEEEACYLRRIQNEPKNKENAYDMESFKAKQLTFGTLSILTNLEETPVEKIYERYKSRMEVETVFDMYKNLLQADRSYMQSDEGFEAFVFINHIASLMYYKIFNLLKLKDKHAQISPQDLLLKLSRVQKLKLGDQWFTSEITGSSEKLFKLLEITVT